MRFKLYNMLFILVAGASWSGCVATTANQRSQGKTIAEAEAEQYETVCTYDNSVGSNVRRKICRDQLVQKQDSETNKRELRKVTTRPQPKPPGAQ